MIEIGRLVVKTAGRDAGKKGVIIDILDDKFVLVDGEVRRRKVNVLHLEPLAQVLDIKKNASHEEIKKSLDEIGLKKRETKPKQKTHKPKKKRKTPEQLKQEAQYLIFSCSQNAFSRGGQTLFIDFNIHTGIPRYFENIPAIGRGGMNMLKKKIGKEE